MFKTSKNNGERLCYFIKITIIAILPFFLGCQNKIQKTHTLTSSFSKKTDNSSLPSRNSKDWGRAVEAARFLIQSSFGATAEDINFVAKYGREAWLDLQLNLPQTHQLDLLDARLVNLGYQPILDDMWSLESPNSFRIREVSARDIWWESSIWGEDQLRQRVAFAMSQIFVISRRPDPMRYHERGFANYQDILSAGAFGQYRDLLREITLNPMMGIYLSSVNNALADKEKNTRPDENYAREILQLFSIGLNLLNMDGSFVLDSEGRVIPTFNQQTVEEFARIFTGWGFAREDIYGRPWYVVPAITHVEPMKSFLEFHDSGQKKLLNDYIVTEGNSPERDINAAIDNITAHQNVAPFICKSLIQLLITSNPSPNYIKRVASVFSDNGKGIKGDMKAVIRAIYLDEEAIAPPQRDHRYYGRRKETPLVVTGIWRAFNARGITVNSEIADRKVQTIRYLNRSSNGEQQPFESPSVFNYFQRNYSPPGILKNKNLFGPEFQVFSGADSVTQANLLSSIIYNKHYADPDLYKKPEPNSPSWSDQTEGTSARWLDPKVKSELDLTSELQLANNPIALVDRINLLLTAGQISESDSILIAEHISLIENPLLRVYEAIFIISILPEYAIQG